jgi:integrase
VRLQHPDYFTKKFCRQAAKLGHPDLRFHDLRGSHATLLLNRGIAVHTVARRLGHDPSVLLRAYAKHTSGADASAAAVIGNLSLGMLTG